MPTATLLIILLLLCRITGAQVPVPSRTTLRAEQFSQANGLSANSIHALAADPHGFIWIGTEDGLNFYDGYRFQHQRRKPGNVNSLAWNNISALATDANGDVWIGSIRNGLSIFHPGQDSFDHIRVPTITKGDDWVTSISFNGNGAWIAAEHGAVLVDKSTFQQKAVVITNIPVVELFAFNDNVLLFLNTGDVWQVDRTGAVQQKIPAHEIFGGDITLNDVQQNSDGFDLFTSHGWYRWSGRRGNKAILLTIATESEDISKSSFTRYLRDSQQREWLARKGEGLLLREKASSMFRPVFNSAPVSYALTDNNITCLQEDAAGNIWIGTQNGLNRVLKFRSWISSLTSDGTAATQAFHRVQAIYGDDDGRLLIGGKNGVFVYDGNSGSVMRAHTDASMRNERFYFFHPLDANHWLVGSYAGVQVLEKSGKNYLLRYDDRFPELKLLKQKRVTTIAAINNDEYLLGGIDAGLWLWNKKTHQVSNAGIPAGKTDFNIYHLLTAEGKMWVATNQGLFRWSDSAKGLLPVLFNFSLFARQPHINSMAYVDGELWLAFTSEGIGRYHTATGKLKVYNTENGLKNNITYSIMADPQGRIWASGVAGILKIERASNRVSYYTTTDGLQGDEFTNFAFAQYSGELYFGGMNGISTIHTAAYRPLKNLPPVYISGADVLQGNHFVAWPISHKMNLPHRQNSINFRFALSDISQQHRVTYQYRLLPIQNKWISNGSSPEVSLTNLSPGDYNLEVSCMSNDSESSSVRSVHFSILPAWYQTGFFRLAVVAYVLLFFFLLVRWYYLARLRKQRMEYEKLLAVQVERQRISSEIHDDIGADLSGIRLLSEMAAKKSKQGDISREVENITTSVTTLAGKMREVIWSLNTENDNLGSLVCYISKQAKSLFENSSIKLDLQMPEEALPDLEIAGEKRRHIYLAVKEALHNCIKHSDAATCLLKMEMKNNNLCITVADDGSGMTNVNGSGGMGMTTMNKGMKAVGGTLQLKNESGISLKFKIPVNEMDRLHSGR